MKILEFQTYLKSDNTVKVPPDVATQIQQALASRESGEQPIRVVLLVPESADDRDWPRLTAEQFLKGYAESDAIYDELSAG